MTLQVCKKYQNKPTTPPGVFPAALCSLSSIALAVALTIALAISSAGAPWVAGGVALAAVSLAA
ncbi:MAG TPA: hypothetical protein IAB92_07080, partial [Candidatus Faecousia faecigallinarum]|nr:hypothetical protein [Candidatus Faecousia faecigallinarum]